METPVGQPASLPKPPSARAHRISAAIILAGVAVCFLPAAALGMYLGLHQYRMVCSSETGGGSGCYEGELMFVSIISGAVFLGCGVFSWALTRVYRYNLEPWRMWWPFMVFCAATLIVVGAVAIGFAAGPRQYP